MPKVLVADDEVKFRDVISIYLKQEGYEVLPASDGEEAIEVFESNELDFVILDVMMPKIDGWSVCRKIRYISEVPIIMLTARSEEYDKLFGFELGVDDYITKPFSPKELIARVKAILKRSNKLKLEDNSTKYTIGNINIDSSSMLVKSKEDEIILTPKEYDLLLFFAMNPNIVFTREQLLNKVWGYEFVGDARTIDTHIKQLREKLGNDKSYICTVWGKGYKLKTGE